MDFFNQWGNKPPHKPQRFFEPTCTVPNQSMTVQQIIAKYSRTGLVPQSFTKRDDGGNVATDPEFDPLDSGFDVLEEAAAAEAAAKAAAGSSEPALGGPASGEPGNSAPAAGEGGE